MVYVQKMKIRRNDHTGPASGVLAKGHVAFTPFYRIITLQRAATQQKNPSLHQTDGKVIMQFPRVRVVQTKSMALNNPPQIIIIILNNTSIGRSKLYDVTEVPVQ